MEPHPLTTTFELISEAQGGSAEARNRLFERYYPRVLRVVRVRVGPELRRRDDLAAVTQRAFAAALAAFDAFDWRDEGRLIHWLSETAEARVRAGEGADEPRSGDAWTWAGADPTRPTAARQAEHDQHRQLEEALDALEPSWRELIILRDFEGCSWTDIVEWTSFASADAARSGHARAMRFLTEAMATLSREPGRGTGTDGK